MSKEQILERERARATPAAIAGVIAVALLIGSFVARAQIPASSNTSTQLLAFNDHPTQLVLSSVLSGLGFALYRTSTARTQRGSVSGICVSGLNHTSCPWAGMV